MRCSTTCQLSPGAGCLIQPVPCKPLSVEHRRFSIVVYIPVACRLVLHRGCSDHSGDTILAEYVSFISQNLAGGSLVAMQRNLWWRFPPSPRYLLPFRADGRRVRVRRSCNEKAALAQGVQRSAVHQSLVSQQMVKGTAHLLLPLLPISHPQSLPS